jgi:hypothetical protein
MFARSEKSWKKAALALAATVGLLAASSPSEAIEFITFDQNASTGGTLSYDGAGGALIGTNIPFDFVFGVLGFVPNPGSMLCVDASQLNDPCLLDFETGPLVSDSANLLRWGANPNDDAIVLSGGLLSGATFISPTDLLFGSIQGASLEFQFGTRWEAGVSGNDTKDEDLIAFFFAPSAPTDFTYLNSELVLTGIGGSGSASGGFSVDVQQADIVNTAVPEPGSALLLLIGLSALATRRFRRS